jgi:hypothetical protein
MKKIIFSQKYHDKNTWGKKLLYHLSQNKNLDIQYNYSIPPILNGGRRIRKNFHTFIIDDIVFVLDDWDQASPTCYLANNTNNISKFYLDNPTIILKIQYCESEKINYDLIYNQCGIKILPFTMFSNHTFELENFQWNKDNDHKYLCCLTGKPWRNRSGWFNFVIQNNHSLPSFVCSHRAGENNNIEENIRFYELLKNTKWGLILKGKGCGGKNRREVEFSSLGMPLVLNYQPIYPFEFIPNKDYVLIEKYEDLFKLKDMDPEPFAEKSKEIYNNYFSPNHGLFNSFKAAYDTAIDLYTNSKSLKKNSYDDKILKITAKDRLDIGELDLGQSISFQYIQGAWKSWGRKNRGFVNPDNTNGRGGNRARLAIYCEKFYISGSTTNTIYDIICIIPEHTQNNPFIFKADKKYDKLFIGMYDQSVLLKNKRGEVFYKIMKL